MQQKQVKIDIKDLSRQQLANGWWIGAGVPFRTDQILRWVYLHQTDHFEEMTNLGKPLRADLEAAFVNDACRWKTRRLTGRISQAAVPAA
jgi:adenine C2-methylase RlmN of 23S rRNA A2503 and tRNA A37